MLVRAVAKFPRETLGGYLIWRPSRRGLEQVVRRSARCSWARLTAGSGEAAAPTRAFGRTSKLYVLEQEYVELVGCWSRVEMWISGLSVDQSGAVSLRESVDNLCISRACLACGRAPHEYSERAHPSRSPVL